VPFGNISSLFLNGPTNASVLPWGSNVRKLSLISDAVANTTTTTNHGTGAAVSVTASPFAASSTTGSQANFGFAIETGDMGGATGARRFYQAGNHSFSCAAASSAAVTVADAQLVLKAYRVQIASTYTRTLLGSATGALFNLGALPGTYLAISVVLALPEIILEPGETIQYSVDVLSAGTVVTGRIITLRFGTAADFLTFPRLSVLADTNGVATGFGDALGITGKVIGTVGEATGFGDAVGVLGAISTTTGTAAGTVDVVGSGASVASTTGAALGSCNVLGVGGKVIGTVGTVDISGGGVTVPEGSHIIDMPRQEMIHRVALLHGLQSGSPLVVSPTSNSVGGLVQTKSGGITEVTVTTTATPPFSGNVDTWIDGLAAVHGITVPVVINVDGRTAAQVKQKFTALGNVTTVERVL
jgi:hypothetical protein